MVYFVVDHTIYIYEVKGHTYDKISAYLRTSDRSGRVGGGHWRRGGGDRWLREDPKLAVFRLL